MKKNDTRNKLKVECAIVANSLKLLAEAGPMENANKSNEIAKNYMFTGFFMGMLMMFPAIFLPIAFSKAALFGWIMTVSGFLGLLWLLFFHLSHLRKSYLH